MGSSARKANGVRYLSETTRLPADSVPRRSQNVQSRESMVRTLGNDGSSAISCSTGGWMERR
jgi:hypothetical protein